VRFLDLNFTRLPVPISISEVARHLSSRRDFLIEPCDERDLVAVRMIATAYGYQATLRKTTRALYLEYIGTREPASDVQLLQGDLGNGSRFSLET
jgi:hypothetical protein